MTNECFERMEGLLNQTVHSKFESVVCWLVNDFVDEGFEKEDIEEYLQIKLKEIFNSKRIQNI